MSGSIEADRKRTLPLPTPLHVERLFGVCPDVLAGKACREFSIHLLMKVVLKSIHYFFL